MLRTTYSFFFALALAVLAPQTTYSQDKPKDPKVVIDLEKPAPADNSSVWVANNFGKTCNPFDQKFGELGPQPISP